MDRLRQHFRRRRSSASSSPLQPPISPTLSHDKQKNKSIGEPRRLYITSNTPDFDANIIRRFQAEGFDVEYLPFVASGTDEPERERKELEKLLHEREDDLEAGERYAVVAYHRPAYLLLSSHHLSTSATNPFPRLCALVTYYPEPPSSFSNGQQQRESVDIIPQSTTSSTTNSCYASLSLLPIQIHLAGPQPSSLHDDYHSHPSKKRHRCHLFFYPESDPGFAESTSKVYDGISSRLAWSRALDCLKRGFGWPGGHWDVPEVESVWEEYWRGLFYNNRNAEETETHVAQTLRLMGGSLGPSLGEDDGYRSDPTVELQDTASVNCVPTMIGGTTSASITNFYTTQFFPSGPPSQTIRLLSRTIGPNRIVDELLLTFTHTEEIPWLLPRVPPTDRPVRILLVMTALFVAGKITRHNIYWDQASVLVQVGLLDPALVPTGFQATGPNREGKETVERIPVVGSEGVERVLD
ncbi:dienelactone hydrolase [Aspergillus steynii IBT 23096]|uniref:Dienelactone hydrolase n=1 Tax=Aspergillus steynii IBT 23096 TaxID=1392250 RepID=A0A2I2GC75_9EURO|nr:dienelactone hydrolase [Aspergillus steynii IBT 23096]PLB50455.1 dienelactone hydrolase [Aspergillus steynii IBT 23096]